MRKVVYGFACSLDGFLAGPEGAMDWLHFSKDAQELMGKAWESTDAILFGRKTWELAIADAPEAPAEVESEIKSYVFSRSLKEISRPGVELVSQGAGEFVKALKAQPGKDISVMSGGDLANSLLTAGVIDEIQLNVHPVLLGGGTPAFLNSAKRIGLELLESRTLEGGCVFLRYRVS
jgi:dihydrofolate reductase